MPNEEDQLSTGSGDTGLSSDTPKISFAILTVSDRCFAETAKDSSGPSLIHRLESDVGGQECDVVWSGTVPDDTNYIQSKVLYCCDELKVDVLLTTGGTGLAPRDVTPESLEPLLDRKIAGLSTVMLLEGLKKTPFASLSRAVVGVRSKTLVVTLPGSRKGALENLEAIASVIPHAVDLIQDSKTHVAATHGEISNAPLLKSKVKINECEETRVRVSPYPLVEMTSVRDTLIEVIEPLSPESVPSEQALGCVLSQDVVSSEDIPQVATSMKDGYAVKTYVLRKWKITAAAYPGKPAATSFSTYDSAVKVSTGSPVPDGTFAVLPVEVTTAVGDTVSTDLKWIYEGAEIRKIGSDISRGQTVAEQGSTVDEPLLGLLATIGKASVMVYRKPVVAVMSTGDEVCDPWTVMEKYGVRDSNRVVLKSLLHSWGYQVVDLGIVKDDPDLMMTALKKGFDSADVVVTSGSMSMGERDLLKDILIQDFNATIHFGRIAMKPGKPTGFASINDSRQYWFGLPGNPASAYVTAHVVVLPALRILSGWTREIFLNPLKAELGEDITPDEQRLEYMRGKLKYETMLGSVADIPKVYTTGASLQRSSNIHGCTGADCLIEVPKGTGKLAKGRTITVLLLRS